MLNRPSRYNIDQLKDAYGQLGFRLVTASYVKNSQPLDLVCRLGHAVTHSASNLMRGRQPSCVECRKIDFSVVKSVILTQTGYTILSELPTKKIDVICPAGHRSSISHASFMNRNRRCNECKHEKRRLSSAQVQSMFAAAGYKTTDSEYVNNRTKLTVQCPQGHCWDIAVDNFSQGRRCPNCNLAGTSLLEIKWLDFVRSVYPSAKKLRFEHQGKRMEFDIFVPELNLAIEIDGLTWHSELFLKEKALLKRKLKIDAARSMGVQVLTFFEDELVFKEEIVKSIILSKLGSSGRKLYARNTTLAEISRKDASQFLDQNHLQGSVTHIISYGLYLGDELIAVITGGRHHRGGDRDCLILSRLCFKKNTSVVGGSSKLGKALAKFALNDGYKTIKSWSDNRISAGRVYLSLGYQLTKEWAPDYSYAKRLSRVSKQSCTKRHLAKMGGVGSTEKAMAESLGYHRIWDCGKKTWQMNIRR